ncbi:ETS factor [Penaeus vannamei]|uniref:ETS factor n=1 Tax=Penaeus vannamei TaxID=6689 RepID=A0A3R7MI30_PENVA|nr:ETS factor [Penaeus vannamei]
MMCVEYRQTTTQYPGIWDTQLLLHHDPSSRQTSYEYSEMYRNATSVSEWDGKECVAWASSVCRRRGLDQSAVDLYFFGTLSGGLLLQFSPQDFSIRLGNAVGRMFYEELQDLVHKHEYIRESDSHDSGDEAPLVVDLSQQSYSCDFDPELSQPIDLSKRCSPAGQGSGRGEGGDAHHLTALDEEGQPDTYLNRISTNRRRHRGPKSWEFLMRLLADERTNPSVIKWEDQSAATFRLIQPHYIAKLYHYKKGQLVKVSERQLVYGCGPDALLFVNHLLNHERPAEETRGLNHERPAEETMGLNHERPAEETKGFRDASYSGLKS